MDVRITVETTFDNGEKRTHQLNGISRPYRVTCPDGIGLRLEDGKRIVEQIRSMGGFGSKPRACAVVLVMSDQRRSAAGLFFPDRATPELQRLYAELGSRHSFREAARMMKSFLPCHPPHHTTVRDRLGRVATGLEKT